MCDQFRLFPVAFVLAAIISGFSACTYIKVSSAYPSSGGTAMILHKAYGTSSHHWRLRRDVHHRDRHDRDRVGPARECLRRVAHARDAHRNGPHPSQPFRHGNTQTHTLVYTVVIAAILAALFDLSRTASMGATFYLVMDIIIHWGVFRHLGNDVGARAPALLTAIALDSLALIAFGIVRSMTDPLIVGVSLGGIVVVFGFERFYLRRVRDRSVSAGE